MTTKTDKPANLPILEGALNTMLGRQPKAKAKKPAKGKAKAKTKTAKKGKPAKVSAPRAESKQARFIAAMRTASGSPPRSNCLPTPGSMHCSRRRSSSTTCRCSCRRFSRPVAACYVNVSIISRPGALPCLPLKSVTTL